MSRQISTSYECGACLHHSPIAIRKPTPFEPTATWVRCAKCKSEFFVQFKKAPGAELRVQYTSLEAKPSKLGTELWQERQPKQTPAEPDKPKEL